MCRHTDDDTQREDIIVTGQGLAVLAAITALIMPGSVAAQVGRRPMTVEPAAPAATPIDARTRATQDILLSEAFVRAEQAGDVATMRRLLATTSGTVATMPPDAFPVVCVAPNWHWVWGYEMVTDASGTHPSEYKLICVRSRVSPNSPAYPHLQPGQ